MVGLGTRDRDLIRLIVAHCDTDLGSIKCEYQHSYLKDLSVAVAVSFFSKNNITCIRMNVYFVYRVKLRETTKKPC